MKTYTLKTVKAAIELKALGKQKSEIERLIKHYNPIIGHTVLF
jgi:hypothetical protein